MLTILGFDLPLPPDLAFLAIPVITFAINLLLWVALAVLMLPMSAAAAGIVSGQQIKVLSSSGALGGGAFGIDVPVFDGIEDFRTFCVERTETLQAPAG